MVLRGSRAFKCAFVFFFCSFVQSAFVFAMEDPLRNLKQYNEPKSEQAIKVNTAKVVLADYALIRRDFAETQNLSDREIDSWILKNAGYIARTQAFNVVSEQLHDPIPIEYEFQTAFRPEGYGRGLVFKTETGLLDGKGFGSVNPRVGTNTNGLLELSQALREYVMQKTVHQLSQLSSEKEGHFTTVETYAVIDWGFDIRTSNNSKIRAGAVLRQAHTREYWNFNSNLPTSHALKIELFLRKFGITSTGLSSTLRNQPFSGYDIINIQGKVLSNDFSVVVDFGTFTRVPRDHEFSSPLAMRAMRATFPSTARFGVFEPWSRFQVLDPLLDRNAETFIRKPLYEDFVSAELFSDPNSGVLYPEEDGLSKACEAMVEKFKEISDPDVFLKAYQAFARRFLCNSESLLNPGHELVK